MKTEQERNEEIERKIARRVVRVLLQHGYSVAVENGGDGYELPPSRKQTEIFSAMFATGQDVLIVYRGGRIYGHVWLVYGNGCDVISDYSARLDGILGPVVDYSGDLEW